jgi:hypothetical protein
VVQYIRNDTTRRTSEIAIHLLPKQSRLRCDGEEGDVAVPHRAEAQTTRLL